MLQIPEQKKMFLILLPTRTVLLDHPYNEVKNYPENLDNVEVILIKIQNLQLKFSLPVKSNRHVPAQQNF
jgi:hypothetical protein